MGYKRLKTRISLYMLIAAVVIFTLEAMVVAAETQPTTGKKTFNIEARQWAYNPSVIRVERGEEVTFMLTSVDVTHGFYLDGYDIDLRVDPNKPALTVTFIADKVGRFGFRCSHTCGVFHPFMTGIFIVEPNSLLPGSMGLAVGIAGVTLFIVAIRKKR